MTVAFIEDSTGTTKHTGSVDASLGTYKATYTLAGSTDPNDAYNWPDGKYRIVVTPAGGATTTLVFYKDTVAPTNTVATVDGTAVTTGEVFLVDHSYVTMVGACGAGTVDIDGRFELGANGATPQFSSSTLQWSGTYDIGIPGTSSVPRVYCLDDAGNYGGLWPGFSGVGSIGITASVVNGNGQVTVTVSEYEVSAGATVSYNIYYGTAPGVTKANGIKVPGIIPTQGTYPITGITYNTGTTSQTITNLASDTKYYFIVTAVKRVGGAGWGGTVESGPSNEVSATPIPTPSAPTGISATAGNGQAMVSWTAVAGATSYNVYYGTGVSYLGVNYGVTTTQGTKVAGATSGGAITGLTSGTTYYFIVTAVNAGGESTASSEVSATPQVPAPSAPTGVSATAGTGQVTVNWTGVTGATSYNVYYRTTAGVTITNGTKVAGATSPKTITGLTNGTTYYFIVTAVNAGGEGSASSAVSVTPQVPAPGTPTGVSVTAGNGQATVNWTAVTGATSYNMYYRTTAGVTTANGTKVTGATSGGAITGLMNGTTHYFVVTAVNAGGESIASSEVSATPQVPAPGAPTGVSTSAGNGQATISWTAVTGATSYNVYYRTTAGVTTANGIKVTGATSGSAITGLANGTIYYFIVTAVNAGGESVTSGEVSAMSGSLKVTTMVSAGRDHSIVLKSDGTVWSWGNNTYGQLGDGTTNQSTMPVQVSGLVGVTSIESGQNHTLALKGDGTVWAWGLNGYGMLGDGTNTNRSVPVQVSGLTGITAIAAGGGNVGGIGHSLALKNDGTVWAWGHGSFGQLGDGSSNDSLAPVQVSNITGVVMISAGERHNAALLSNGTVWTWGTNMYGQLGNNSTTESSSPVQVSGLTGVTAIFASYLHTVALKSDGTVWTWGFNDSGQLGDGTTTSRSTPVQVSGLSGVTAIAGGYSYTIALKSDGTVWAWGQNGERQLGDGTTTSRSAPVQVSGLSGVTVIASGLWHNIVLKSDGTVWSWGYNTYGQVDATTLSISIPAQKMGLASSKPLSISNKAGGFHTLSLKSDGTVWAWGLNSSGQLGNGSFNDSYSAVQVSNLTGVKKVAGGETHSLALKNDGTVWTWGSNTAGQLGDGTTTNSAIPVQTATLTGIEDIAGGYNFSLALKNDGTVWAWGAGSYGKLGNGATANSSSPVQVSGLTNTKAIAAGQHHAFALKTDGTVWAWGWNASGQLGDGTNTDNATPVQIATLTGIKTIDAKVNDSMALKNDGTVWTWGDNTYGQLGNNSTTSSSSPVQVGGLAGAVKIAAGSTHMAAMKADGSYWAWGRNNLGQLGNGNTTDSLNLVQGTALAGLVADIAAGYNHTIALKSDGTVWAWGSNANGRLGNGSIVDSSAPVQSAGTGF